jgi:type IV pilus assembly protein PilY1
MDRHRRLLLLPAVLATLVVGARAASAAPLPDEMRPIVFLLIDTSESMQQDVLDDGSSTAYCGAYLDETPLLTGDDIVENRWLVTMEVLTGAVEGLSYACDWHQDPTRSDYLWSTSNPHIRWAWENQRQDGLLDLMEDDISFSLMTFDGKANTSVAAPGDYSYFTNGPVGTLAGFPLDVGIRNASAPAGGLVHPTISDAEADLRAANALIQSRILPIVPYQGAFTGPALADILLYLEGEPRLQPRTPANPGGDPFASCRQKYVLLITDGQASRDGQLGYHPAHYYATRLHAEFGVPLFVVGFNVPAAERAFVDALADAGGTAQAYFANNPTSLASQLSLILGGIDASVDSRTRPIVTNVTRNEPEDRQYRYWSARVPIGGNPVDREGIVEWEMWSCREECQSALDSDEDIELDLCSILDLGMDLAQQPERTIHTVVTNPAAGGTFSVEEVVESNPALTPEALAVPVQAEYPQVALFGPERAMPFGHLVFEQEDGSPDPTRTAAEKRAEYTRQLLGWVRADAGSRRARQPLGGIYRATPALQTAPPTFVSTIPSFTFYANEQRNRPNVLYVASNDGQLHAFRVDRGESISARTGTDPGDELWSFVPGFALKRLHLADDTAVTLLDGPPVVAEVLPLRETVDADPTVEKDRWRSVAIVPAGPTDRGIFALDVTNPARWTDSMFLWEITPEGRCVGPGDGICYPFDTAVENDFRKLGYTLARPAVGTIFMNVGVAPKERDVAFFAGGDDPNDEGVGSVFYVVDVLTGAKIMEFSDAQGNVFGGPSGATLAEHPLVGTPIAYSTALGQFVSRIFVGDAGGRMWRISINSPDPEAWRMDLFHDAYKGLPANDPLRAPIYEQPTVAASQATADGRGGRGLLTLIYTTGNVDQKGAQPLYRIWSLVERRQDTAVVTADENWRYDFPAGEQPVGQPIVFAGVAYFISYVTPADQCDVGTSRLWGVDFDEARDGALIPRMDQDGDPYNTTDDVVLYQEYENTLFSGVRIIRVPSCTFTLDPNDAYSQLPPEMTGSLGDMPSGAGGLRLVMQQAGSPGAGQPQPAGAPGGNTMQAKIAHQEGPRLAMPPNQVIIQSWATIFD